MSCDEITIIESLFFILYTPADYSLRSIDYYLLVNRLHLLNSWTYKLFGD